MHDVDVAARLVVLFSYFFLSSDCQRCASSFSWQSAASNSFKNAGIHWRTLAHCFIWWTSLQLDYSSCMPFSDSCSITIGATWPFRLELIGRRMVARGRVPRGTGTESSDLPSFAVYGWITFFIFCSGRPCACPPGTLRHSAAHTVARWG